ncbi:hypothetical protein pb186bvf_014477 [Paramecium bursaria]
MLYTANYNCYNQSFWAKKQFIYQATIAPNYRIQVQFSIELFLEQQQNNNHFTQNDKRRDDAKYVLRTYGVFQNKQALSNRQNHCILQYLKQKNIQIVNINQFINFLLSQRFEIVSNSLKVEVIHSDLLLMKLLIRYLQKIVSGGQIQLKQQLSGIQLDIQGVVPKTIKKKQVYFINKLLFHIGIGMCEIYKKKDQSVQIIINILDIQEEFLKYE